jgi:hypothetical protein
LEAVVVGQDTQVTQYLLHQEAVEEAVGDILVTVRAQVRAQEQVKLQAEH